MILDKKKEKEEGGEEEEKQGKKKGEKKGWKKKMREEGREKENMVLLRAGERRVVLERFLFMNRIKVRVLKKHGLG